MVGKGAKSANFNPFTTRQTFLHDVNYVMHGQIYISTAKLVEPV
jgi:hypothetical protein